MLMISILPEDIRNLLDVDSIVERCGICNFPSYSGYLPLEALDKMPDGHTGWNGVRVDDQVWGQTFTGERHVLKYKNITTFYVNCLAVIIALLNYNSLV